MLNPPAVIYESSVTDCWALQPSETANMTAPEYGMAKDVVPPGSQTGIYYIPISNVCEDSQYKSDGGLGAASVFFAQKLQYC